MIICRSGRVLIRNKGGKDTFVLRLNLIEQDSVEQNKTKYRTKDIFTGLIVNKANQVKANALLADEIAKYSEIGATMLFPQYCEHWLEKKKCEIEQITYEGYTYRVGHIISYFEKHPVTVGNVSAEDADSFYHYLLTKEKTSPAQRLDAGLANKTVKDIATLFRAILSDAIELGHVKDLQKVRGAIKRKIPKRPETPSRKSYVGEDELTIFLDAIKGHALEAAFLLTLFYGMRREEILGLKWSALRNERLYVEHTVTRLISTVAKDRTKTDGSYRYYLIPDEIIAIFARINEEQRKNQELYGNTYQKSDYIFVWPDGHQYSPDYLTKSFKKIVRENNQLDNNLSLKSLRNSCISILVHAGRDVKDVQTWVGHRDVQTTLNVYAQSNEKQQQGVMECMVSKIFSPTDQKNS